MQYRCFARPGGGRWGLLSASGAAASLFLSVLTPAPVRAQMPVRALLTRPLTAAAAPTAADALRFSVYGDGSGARIQPRLMALGAGQDVGDGFAAPAIRLDFKGWKTVIVPLSDFTFHSEHNPDAVARPLAAPDTVQFAVTADAARIFIDDLAWTTAGAAPTDAPLQMIDDFERAPAPWRVSGTYEQIRAATLSRNSLPTFVKSGGGSLVVQVRSRAIVDKQLHGTALNARLKTAKVPYVLYARAPFDLIVPDSTPAPTEIMARPALSLFACADETEPVTFAVYAGKDLTNATVTVASEFLSESKQSRLPRAAISVHVVKVWEQAGLSSVVEPGAAYRVPELLVKDDRAPLVPAAAIATGSGTATGTATASATVAGSSLPDARLTGDPVTTIPAGTSKQFWITVRVPKSQSPSRYTGQLLFSTPGVPATPITMTVEVLPMRLRMPFLQYGVDFRARLSGETGATTSADFTRQLVNIREHGFRFVSLYDPLPSLTEALGLYRQAGLGPAGPVIIMSPVNSAGDVRRLDEARAAVGLAPNFDMYVGTPLPLQQVASAAENFTALRGLKRRPLTAAPVTGPAAADTLSALVDVPIYNVTAEYPQRLLMTGRRENPKRDWWSWNPALEQPLQNRLYAGYLLYRTGLNSSPLYGAFVGPYQFSPNGDPFNETAMAAVAGENKQPVLRPQMLAYPTRDGLLDTLQWEAAREGVDDIRYITNLKTYIRELIDLKISKELTDEADAFLRRSMSISLATATPGELQAIRRGIADRALKLLTILRAKGSRYPD